MIRKIFPGSIVLCLLFTGISQATDPGILGIHGDPERIMFYACFDQRTNKGVTMIDSLFQSIDSMNTDAFTGFLSENCTFRFGNMPEVTGRKDIREFVGNFFASIEALSHEILEYWNVSSGIICHGNVTYIRKDGSGLTVPFANILKTDSGKIVDYSIFADTSGLYS